MKRFLESELINWQMKETRSPLLLQGARQVGKTYLLEQFGKENFDRYFLFDFEEDPSLKLIFDVDLDPERIIQELSLYAGEEVDPQKDLLILDEIQLCPRAITSLKYFSKKLPKSYICASGSLLGVGLNESSFPVGKVHRLTLYPMNFLEFLLGIGEKLIYQTLEKVKKEKLLSETLHRKAWLLLKYYFITGGLPAVVNSFNENKNNLELAFKNVRKVQEDLIEDYLADINKHSGKLKAIRIESIFKNIPIQLAREAIGQKKFNFKGVLEKESRFSTLEGPIEWLIKAGLVYQVKIVSVAKSPLKAYGKDNRFSLFIFDIGILGAMLQLHPKNIYEYDYGSYKGYFAENFVLQELTSITGSEYFSWQNNTSQIDFLLNIEGEVYPVEVKAGSSAKAKSLKVFKEKYSPQKSYILSGRPYRVDGEEFKVPLYMASSIFPD